MKSACAFISYCIKSGCSKRKNLLNGKFQEMGNVQIICPKFRPRILNLPLVIYNYGYRFQTSMIVVGLKYLISTIHIEFKVNFQKSTTILDF